MNVVIDCNSNYEEGSNNKGEPLKICLYTFYSIFTVILLAFPISEIVIGVIYKNKLLCDTELFVNLYIWLVTKGSVECFVILCLPFLFCANKRSILKCIIVIIIYLFNIFSVIWIISGSIIFFKDCSKDVPTNLYPYIIFIITFGYIGILNIYVQKSISLS